MENKEINLTKWLLMNDTESLQKLENPPSLADGLNKEVEKELRYLGCELIQQGAILLKLPQTAAATGQILFQRFYYQRSFVRYNFEHVVMGCLLLASKIEEEPRRCRDVLNAYYRLKQIHNNRDYGTPDKKFHHMVLDQNYLNMKLLVIKAERRILNVLGFVVHVDHPHKLIYVYLHSLFLLDNKEMLQKAWSYMNDGLRTDLFLRHHPETIACACIHLAAKTIDLPVLLPPIRALGLSCSM
uniref:Cyclin-like domain-containing protein n=1 Tax=Ditylenchus dipsaci TaxID=166011 RepID=A0A915DVS2_9BILA